MNKVLLTIPCYHESRRIVPFLQDLASVFCGSDVAIQIVDDGSGEAEQRRLLEVTADLRMSLRTLFLDPLLLPRNLGKGGAVYASWNAARDFEWIMFADADGSASGREIQRLLAFARDEVNEADAWFASRIKMLGRRVNRLLTRHILGRVYATLVSNLLNVDVYDSQCGLKLLKRSVWDSVHSMLSAKGFSFDAELLVALLDAGCDVREFPIDWHETPGGKVRIARDSVQMAIDIWRIRERRSSATWKQSANNARQRLHHS